MYCICLTNMLRIPYTCRRWLSPVQHTICHHGNSYGIYRYRPPKKFQGCLAESVSTFPCATSRVREIDLATYQVHIRSNSPPMRLESHLTGLEECKSVFLPAGDVCHTWFASQHLPHHGRGGVFGVFAACWANRRTVTSGACANSIIHGGAPPVDS